ncbi:hypothetical protein [Phocaeicola sp.]
MSTRGQEKTGKMADARREIEAAQQKVESARANLFAKGGNFEDNARLLRCALVDLSRKEERYTALKRKTELVRDDRNIIRVFRLNQHLRK